MAITESQIKVLTNDLRPSMAVFESQFEVVMIEWGSSPVVPSFHRASHCHFFIRSEVIWDFKAPQDRWRGTFPWDQIMMRVIWMVLGATEGVVDHKTWCFAFYAGFSEAVVSSFENTWIIGKQHVPLYTAPLMSVQHVPSLLEHAMLRLPRSQPLI